MDTQKKLIIFGVFSVIAILALMILLPKSSKKKQSFFKPKPQPVKNLKETDDPVLAKEIFLKSIQEREEKRKRERDKRKNKKLGNENEKLKKEESNAVKKKFLQDVYLEADLPQGLTYSEVDIDMDEPVKLIRGDTPYQEARLLVGATTIVPQQPEEILAFIRENISAFPDMDKHLVSQMQRTVQVQNPQPGFKQITVWEAHGNNESEVLVYLPRSDNRGSYVFSYSGDSSLIQNNDDYFEQLLQSLKPQSAPENIYKDVQ